MRDLEQQIKAWADAAMADAPDAERAGAAAAQRVLPTSAGGDSVPLPAIGSGAQDVPYRWVRPILAAAVLVLVVGIVAAAFARTAGEEVRSGPVASVPATASLSVGEGDVGFEVLDVGPDGGEPAGTVRAAYDDEQLADLWSELGDRGDGLRRPEAVGPVPEVDFDRAFVLAMTLDRASCSTALKGFEHGSGREFITPVFEEGAPECRGGPMRTRYVVAVDWYSDAIRLELPSEDAAGDGDRGDVVQPSMILRRQRPDPVVVDLELDGIPGEIHAGDHVGVNVVVQNATGHPLRTTGCGEPFAVGLRRGGKLYAAGTGWCLETFEIPTGMSVYRAQLSASQHGCTPDPSASLPERCQAGGSVPDLDPGTYEVVLIGPEGFDAQPPGMAMDVVPRRS